MASQESHQDFAPVTFKTSIQSLKKKAQEINSMNQEILKSQKSQKSQKSIGSSAAPPQIMTSPGDMSDSYGPGPL